MHRHTSFPPFISWKFVLSLLWHLFFGGVGVALIILSFGCFFCWRRPSSLEAEKAKNVAHFNFIVCHVISNSHLSLLEIHYYSSALSLFIHHHHRQSIWRSKSGNGGTHSKRLVRELILFRSGYAIQPLQRKILIISKKFLSKLDPRASFSPPLVLS